MKLTKSAPQRARLSWSRTVTRTRDAFFASQALMPRGFVSLHVRRGDDKLWCNTTAAASPPSVAAGSTFSSDAEDVAGAVTTSSRD